MILQLILIDGVRNIVLPGVCLHYGNYGIMDKVIALIWGLRLVVGTNYEQLELLMCHIVSVTSDMGTEFGVTDCPNVL